MNFFYNFEYIEKLSITCYAAITDPIKLWVWGLQPRPDIIGGSDMSKKKKKLKNSINKNGELAGFDTLNTVAKNSSNNAKEFFGNSTEEISEHRSSAITEFDLMTRFKSTYRLRTFEGALFIFNGKTYECATHELIVELLQDCFTAAEARQITYDMYSNAASMLLNNKMKEITTAHLDESKIFFKNGVYDVFKQSLITCDYNCFFTHQLNVSYKPKKEGKCPNFKHYIRAIAGNDKEIEKRIWYMLAYCLLPVQKRGHFFVLKSDHNSGANLLVEFIERLYNNDDVAHISLHDFEYKEELYELRDKALNTFINMDSDVISTKAEKYFNKITYSNRISCSGTNPRTVYNSAKFVFVTNSPLVTKKCSAEFYDRMILMPLSRSGYNNEQQQDMLAKFWDERNAILRKALKYAKDLIENDFKFPKCEVADFITENWRYGRNSSIAFFVNAKCDLSKDSTEKTHTAKLYESYAKYCKKNNTEPTSVKKFSQVLSQNFGLLQSRWYTEDNHYLHGFFGISLKSEKSKDSGIYYNIDIK